MRKAPNEAPRTLSLTVDRLKELLDYDPKTGVFTRKVSVSTKAKAGMVAGTFCGAGYRQIMIDGVSFRAQRLAWLYVYGKWPNGVVDHINGVKADNRIENLRDVVGTSNIQNMRRAHRDSATGVLGVTKLGARYRAYIWHDNKSRHLGVFDTAEMAHAAYVEAKRKIHSGCTL